ncbi:unnamed protein product [Lactuca virosa]|uniref:Uncharacterized protein n=1 Tax=Lactuca virosa TaxID=75947 RepID=A0AAU9PW20_9ASTR|nr:unnamed protein product [Lactuca virosa]
MKVTCVTTGVEGGRQVVNEQVASGRFDTQEPSTMVELSQVVHASVKKFMETDFAFLLYLCELDLEGLRQLCRDPDAAENRPEGDPLKVGSSSTTLGK